MYASMDIFYRLIRDIKGKRNAMYLNNIEYLKPYQTQFVIPHVRC